MWALIVTLIIVGLLLFGVELLIIPGLGVVGILGLVSLVASCYIAFVNFGTATGIAVLIAEIVVTTLFIIVVLRSRTWKKITLNTNINSKTGTLPQNRGVEIGMTGTALTRMAPAGMAEINGETVEAFCRDTIINASAKIEVVEVSDNKVVVKEIV